MHISDRFFVLLVSSAVVLGPFGAQASGEEDVVSVNESPLRVGANVEGEVRAESPVIHSPKLDSDYGDGPVRGVRFAFEVETSGPVTIDLRSYFFDAYLVLADASGQVIGEDDDGLIGSQSRIVRTLSPGRYTANNCALHGGLGAFVLEVRAGAITASKGSERSAEEIEDARNTVDAREATLGADHPDTGASLNNLASLYYQQGRYRDAEIYVRRVLKFVEATLGPDHPETASTINNLAVLYQLQGRYGEAVPLCQRALEIAESALGPSHPVTRINLSNLATLYKLLRRHAEAEPLYERVVEITESTRGSDHPATAASLNNLAGLYKLQGRYSDAEPLFLRALAIRESSAGPDHPETATSLNDLAGLYRLLGRYSDAESLHLRALAIRESSLGPGHRDTASSLNNLAVLYQQLQGRYSESERLHRRALAIRESSLGQDHPDTAITLDNLANLLKQLGRYSEAEPMCLRGLSIREFSLGPDHPSTARSVNNLAHLYQSQGRHSEAEPLYLRALSIRESSLGPHHPDTAVSVSNLALLYQFQGRYSEAEPLYLRVLAIVESSHAPDHPETASSLNNLATLYRAQGRYSDAERLHLRALAIRESSLGPDHPSTASSLGNLAALYDSQSRYSDSEPLYQRALEITESAFGLAHPETGKDLNNLACMYQLQGRHSDAERLHLRALSIVESSLGPDHPRTATGLSNVSLMYHDQGRAAEASPYVDRLLTGGHSWTLRELSTSTSERRFSVAGTERSYVDTALSIWSASAEPRADLDQIYGPICAWKGMVFRHVTRLSRALSARSEEDPELRRLRSGLVDLEGQLSVLAYAERIEDPEAHKEQLAELRDRRGEIQREILSRLGMEPERESTSGAELSRLLPDRAAVLDFLVHRGRRPQLVEDGQVVQRSGWEAPRLSCFVTSSGAGEPVFLDLGEVAPIRDATDAWLDDMTGGRRGLAVVVVGEDPGEDVRELLLAPILAAIPADTTRLFVIPDDFLGQVPFGAVPIGGGRFVLEAVDVVYATDPVTLRNRLEASPRSIGEAPSILAVGGVDYDDRSATSESALLAAVDESRRGSRAFSRDWGPLPGTAEEVDGLSLQAKRTHSAAEPPRVLKGADATEESVKTETAGKTILHFATHGFFEREGLVSRWQSALERAHQNEEAQGFAALSQSSNPYRGQEVFARDHSLEGEEPGLLAGLILAGANRASSEDPTRDDGILTATEVSGLDLSECRLAVLSACQSSLGTGQSGEGLQSLRRGFQEAGAQSVIASLWKVDDEATQKLMHAFYEELWTNKRGVGDALRRARLKLLREKKDPYYWGAFTLSGEWR